MVKARKKKAKKAKPARRSSKALKASNRPRRPAKKPKPAKEIEYRFRMNGEILPGFFTFEQAVAIMRVWPYDSKTEPSKRPLFEVLLPDGSVHYTDRRS